MDQKELYELINHGTTLSKETKSILLELDTTPSVSTQAYLNDLLLAVRTRLLNKNKIVDEATGKDLSLDAFNQWITNEFTSYSSNMYFKSIKEER